MSMMLNILSARLAELTAKSELSCRGVMRFAVSDVAEQLQQTTDPKVWREHLQAMNFQDWEALLRGNAFVTRLTRVGIKNTGEVIAQLRQTLVEKQSLLTMMAR